MRKCLILIAILLVSQRVSAQSAIEQHVWQEARSFPPLSRTALAITGEITLSGNAQFATKGSMMSMTFENGAMVFLTSEGASWRAWGLIGADKKTAEVFRLSDDPGPLQNGNTLCGGNQGRASDQEHHLYAVFYEDSLFGLDPLLTLAIFKSTKPPFDIDSPGLCGTYSYVIRSSIDDTFEPARPASSSDNDVAHGAWRLSTGTNPIDDSKTVTLSLAAEIGSSRFGEPITFVARCKSNKTEAYVVWGEFLGDDSRDVYAQWKNVIVRVGTGVARSEQWGVSTDRKATFAPSWAGNLLKELLDEDQLVLQTIPYGENPSTAIFNVSGLRNVLGELAGTCNWAF